MIIEWLMMIYLIFQDALGDYRERSPETQILGIAPDEIKKLRAIDDKLAVDLELLR